MENIDKGLNVTKWVLIVWLNIHQMPQNLSSQFVCLSPKVLEFNEKRLPLASVLVRDLKVSKFQRFQAPGPSIFELSARKDNQSTPIGDNF